MRRWGLILRSVLMAAVLMGSSAGFAAQTAPNGVTVVDEKTAGDVSLKVGGRLEVHLDANHTTGYLWVQVPVEKPVLQKQGKAVYHENQSAGKVGVGGVEIWKFKAFRAGKQSLRFEYRRPWEKTASAAKTLSFDVTVE
jgi:inhibitor of cysteine peptidase